LKFIASIQVFAIIGAIIEGDGLPRGGEGGVMPVDVVSFRHFLREASIFMGISVGVR